MQAPRRYVRQWRSQSHGFQTPKYPSGGSGKRGCPPRFAQSNGGAPGPTRPRVCRLRVHASTYTRTVFAILRETRRRYRERVSALQHPSPERGQFHEHGGRKVKSTPPEKPSTFFKSHPDRRRRSAGFPQKRRFPTEKRGRTRRKNRPHAPSRDRRPRHKEDITQVPIGVSMKYPTVRNY